MVESRQCCKFEHKVLCVFMCARAHVCHPARNQEGTQKLLWMGRWINPTRVENLPNRYTSKRVYTISIMQKAQETGRHRRFELEQDVEWRHLSTEDLASILYTCKKRKDRAYALRVHNYMREIGLDTHDLLGNRLVSTLAEVGNMHDAHQLFSKLGGRNGWSINALIMGYIKCGKPQYAFALYEEIRNNELGYVNAHSFIALLKACAKKKDLERGMKLHANVGFLKSDPFVGNTLVDMYAKCGELSKAQEVFTELQIRDVVSWTALIGGYTEQGHGEEALKYFKLMQCQGVVPNAVTLICGLKACGSLKAIAKGQEIHVEAERRGFTEHDLSVSNTVVDMYAKCGVLDKAKQVFDKLVTRDVISWTALIVGYTEHDDGEEALKCFNQMQLEGICPNAVTYASSLKVCGVVGAMDKGKEVHARIEKMGILDRDLVVGNTLVDMYAKCGLMTIAQDVFTDLRVQNVVGWTALISGYADYGHDEEALKCLDRMQVEGISLDLVSLACSLKSCGNMRAAFKGLEIHAEIERIGAVLKDPFVGSTLVNMYAKCGSLAKAQEVFVKLPVQEVTTWTALIAAFIDHGRCDEALNWFKKMQLKSIIPSAATLIHCLKACGSLRIVHEGRRIHAEIEKMGLLEGNLAVGNALVDMYTKFSLLNEASEVFDKLPIRNIVSWNALIAGYIEHGLGNEALQFLKQMQLEGVPPDSFTYVCSLKGCGSMGAVDEVKRIHSEIEKKGFFDSNLELSNTLVDIYAKYGLLITAQEVFKRLSNRDVVSWNALITGFSEHEYGEEVLKILEEMHLANVSPDSATFICGLRACGQVGARDKGQDLHAEIERQGLLDIDVGVGNSLVDIYGKWGLLAQAQEVFNKLPKKDTVSWTALIAGYAEDDRGEEAIKCFEQMELEGVSPNDVTFVCMLKACIKAGASNKAQEIHCEIERQGILEKDLVVGNTLIDFYAKSGMVGKAQEVFDRLPTRDALSWTPLIAGYAEDGYGVEAVKLYEDMQSEGLSPDAHTFACSLKACGMIGATELGQQIHSDIEMKGLWEADIITSNTLVDMYAKSGSLLIAEQLFRKLTIRDIVAWNALISGYANQGYGEKALQYLEQMLLEGIHPNAITFVGSLKACSTIQATQKGQELHIMLDRRGLLDGDIVLSNTLLDMYAKLGLLAKAAQLFDKLSVRNVASWTSLIAGYTEHEHANKALNCYKQMQYEGVYPNLVTCVCSLKACVSIGAIEKGREIHAEIERRGFAEGVVIGNTLVHMYAKYGLVEEAQNVFDKHPAENIVSWNALIAGYSKLGENMSVLHLFKRMVGKGLKPSMVTFVIVLNACSQSCLFDCCLMYFEAMSKDYGIVLSIKHITSIVGLFCRAGQLNDALTLINKMPVCPNLAVWRNMLNVCKDSGNLDLGHHIFERAMCLEKTDSAACVLLSHIYAGAH